jgi:hypothetical protein
VGLATTFYSLRLETSLFWVASYDSQGYGGGIGQGQRPLATGDLPISESRCRAPSGAHDQIYINLWPLRSCSSAAPSLTRGRVCLLYMLLGFANVVFLGSESLGSRDHVVLSQIRDFPFRRLLRLAGVRWRYSTPPPHGITLSDFGQPRRNHAFQQQSKCVRPLLCFFTVRCREYHFST